MATDTTGLYEDLLKQAFLHREMEGEKKDLASFIKEMVDGIEVNIHVHTEKGEDHCSVKLQGSPLALVVGTTAALDGALRTINDIENKMLRALAKKLLLESIEKCLLADAAKEIERCKS